MQTQYYAAPLAATAVLMSILPGNAYGMQTDSYDPAAYMKAIGVVQRTAVEQAWEPVGGNDLFIHAGTHIGKGTYTNLHLAQPLVEDNYLNEMLRVAHTLATESVDIDADIARIVDEEFWNLI